MKTYTRNEVLKALKLMFPNEDQEDILKILDLYGLESQEKEKDRVQLAIIKLSNGDTARLRHFVEIAKNDYRDVLYEAEYNTKGNIFTDPYKKLF